MTGWRLRVVEAFALAVFAVFGFRFFALLLFVPGLVEVDGAFVGGAEDGLEAAVERGVAVEAEVVEGAVFRIVDEPGVIEGLFFDLGGEYAADEEGVVADAMGVLETALDPGDAVLKERGVDLGGAEGGELGQLELADVSAGDGAEVVGGVEEVGRGEVEGKLLGEPDHVVRVAGGVDDDAKERGNPGQWRVPDGGHDVGLVAPAGGDEGDGAAVEEAGGV